MVSSGFTDWLSRIIGSKNTNRLTSFASSYGRRMAEPYYDQLEQTEFFQNLKKNPKPKRYAIEAVVNAIVAILEEKIPENTPARKIAKDIFMDSGSELNKRLLNGDSAKKILSDGMKKMNQESREKLAALFILEEEQLRIFFEWLVRVSENEKARYLRELQSFSVDELIKFAQLDEGTRDNYFKFTKPPEKKNPIEGLMNPLRQRMINYLKKEGG